jgi:hypothetical protein
MVYAFLDNISSYAIGVIDNNRLQVESKNDNKGICKFQFSEVSIIGINSAKFDMNWLIKNISGNNYKISSTL